MMSTCQKITKNLRRNKPSHFSPKAECVFICRVLSTHISHGILNQSEAVSLDVATGQSTSTDNAEKIENQHEHQIQTHPKRKPYEQKATRSWSLSHLCCAGEEGKREGERRGEGGGRFGFFVPCRCPMVPQRACTNGTPPCRCVQFPCLAPDELVQQIGPRHCRCQ